MGKTWLITGCSEGGIGAAIARCALEAGNNVVVTARNTAKVASIIKDFPDTAFSVTLDVTDQESIKTAVANAVEHFGAIDVLVNNAGYCYRASVEESEDTEVMKMFQTNLFGLIAMTKEVLPVMRRQHSGIIVNFSSIAALSASPASAFYASSKAAVELVSDGLRKEVAPLGIQVMVVEPGAFRTNFFSSSLKSTQMKISDYKDTAWKRYPENSVDQKNQPGDPERAGKILLQVVQGEKLPFRLLLGRQAIDFAHQEYRERMEEIDMWKSISETADFE